MSVFPGHAEARTTEERLADPDLLKPARIQWTHNQPVSTGCRSKPWLKYVTRTSRLMECFNEMRSSPGTLPWQTLYVSP
jgi:hypothetical protein